MADVPTPTDEQLDVWIRARLQIAGVDIEQLHPTQTDPETGSPSQAALLASVRTFLAGPGTSGARVGGTPRTIRDLVIPPPAGGASQDADRLGQQSAPPLLYPSITEGAWTA